MAKANRRYRAVWEDRFTEPTWEDLCACFSKEIADLCEELRQAILDDRVFREEVRWCGLPWRWSLAFVTNRQDDLGWAYLVPNPETPTLGMPLDVPCAESLIEDTESRRIKQTIAESKRTNGCVWVHWPVSTREELEDVLVVIHRKRAYERA